jgi:nucleotide-binding universal stress UspA family protein
MESQHPPLPDGPPEGAVVVGVGLAGAEAAITFAVEEASRARRPLHLLHVLRVRASDAYPAVYKVAAEAADEALDLALAQALEPAAGRVPVTCERVDDGWLVRDLVRHTGSASLVVLQHRRMGRWQRLVAGSTVSGVASRSAVPVVSVPEDWLPGREKDDVVTVGVQTPDEAAPLVRRALELARLRDARVVVVHAWWLYGGYDTMLTDPAFHAEQEREVRKALDPAIATARDGYADVPLTVEVRHEVPVRALLDSSTDSQLLVLGRRHHLLPLGSHLGPVVRAVLRDAAGPVLVAPELEQADAADADDSGKGTSGRESLRASG